MIRAKKWLSGATATLLALSLVAAGCGTAKDEKGAQGGGGGNKTFRVAMVTDVGGVNDNSFNESAWNGLQKLQQDKGAEVKYVESKSDADYVPNLTSFVKDGYDLTWGIGYLMGDAVKEVAKKNPDAKLAIVDFDLSKEGLKNVASVTFKEHEGAFLVGVIAGLMTKTNKVGFVGGMEFDVIKRFENGFKAGVKTVNPKADVVVVYTGAFNKPDLGKQTAASMYDQGVDIIFHASGQTGDGVFNEAKERRKAGKTVWVIGVDKDQSLTFGTDVTLTSMVKRVDNAVYTVSEKLLNGQFPGGQVLQLGLKEDGVGLPDTTKQNVPADVLAKVEEYKKKIINGEIKVPATDAEYQAQFK